MCELYFETPINISVEELYNFHLDTNNLPKITPKNTSVKIIKLPLPMKKANIIELDIKKFGLTQRWIIQIKELIENKLITDFAIKSPFGYFEHQHIFKKVDENKSILCDKIKFQLPLAPLSNILLPFVKNDIKKMFEYRHKVTKLELECKINTLKI